MEKWVSVSRVSNGFRLVLYASLIPGSVAEGIATEENLGAEVSRLLDRRIRRKKEKLEPCASGDTHGV